MHVPVHVPYRDSKLTQLLWDSLKGTGRALMLACLAPLKQQTDETLNTLNFASMAIRIKSNPVVFVNPQVRKLLIVFTCLTHCRQPFLRAAYQRAQQPTKRATVPYYIHIDSSLSLNIHLIRPTH